MDLLLGGKTFHLKTYKGVCSFLTVTHTLVSISPAVRAPDLLTSHAQTTPDICATEHSWKGPALQKKPHRTQGGELLQDGEPKRNGN